MKIISFAWTTPALLAGQKTCTCRDWTTGYAHSFKAGELVQAWDKSPRANGRQVGTIRLKPAPYQESTTDMPDSDWWAEGFWYLEQRGARVNGVMPRELYSDWKTRPVVLWVVRFEVVELFKKEA